jgi:hypothetical protein
MKAPPDRGIRASAYRAQVATCAIAIDRAHRGNGCLQMVAGSHKVRKTPCRPRSWANSSLLLLHSHRNAWTNLHLLGQPNTPCSPSSACWPSTPCPGTRDGRERARGAGPRLPPGLRVET